MLFGKVKANVELSPALSRGTCDPFQLSIFSFHLY
jgi:hypothetical protein